MEVRVFLSDGEFAGTAEVELEHNHWTDTYRVKGDKFDDFHVSQRGDLNSGERRPALQLRANQFPGDLPHFKRL